MCLLPIDVSKVLLKHFKDTLNMLYRMRSKLMTLLELLMINYYKENKSIELIASLEICINSPRVSFCLTIFYSEL